LRIRWYFLLGLGAAVVVAAAVYWFRVGSDGKAPAWQTARIERGSLVAAVSATGSITPVASVSVGSQVSGLIQQVLVDFNHEVKQGDVIARLDPETFRHRVRQAEADLDAARAQVLVQQSQVNARRADVQRVEVSLGEARRDSDRKSDLHRRGFISVAERDRADSLVRTTEQDLLTAKAALEVALAQVRNSEAIVNQREAALDSSRVDLERTVIRSPVDGVVIKRSIDAGQTVAASLQAPELFVIARNLRDMQVDTSIDESDITRIRQGLTASFTVDAFPGRSFEGRVEQVRKAAQNIQNVITYVVVVRFSNTDGSLLPGMTANVRIVTERRDDVLKVTNAALRYRPPPEWVNASVAPAADRSQVAPSAASPSAAASGSSATPANNAGAAAMQAWRDRLVRELGLSPEQTAQLDSLFQASRERGASIRQAAPEERQKLIQAQRQELRARIQDLLTAEQKPRYELMLAELGQRTSGGGRGRLWLVQADGRLAPLEVQTGISDGASTEVRGTGLEVGLAVATGMPASSSTSPRPGGAPRLFF
jgi:HlyD family secretion protein